MSVICPTVTATDIATYDKQLGLVSSFAKRIHIDLMDGVFAPTTTPDPKLLTVASGIVNDIHVMYKNPESIVDSLINLKPNLIIVHTESGSDIPLLASKLRQQNIKTGIAILPDTTVEQIAYLLPHIQHVLIFGGHLGYHGGQADLNQLQKVEQLRKISKHLEISWDGGANANNAIILKSAGIDVINVGSGIHESDNPKLAYQKLVELAQ